VAALIYGGKIDDQGIEPHFCFAETRECDSDQAALYTLLQLTQGRLDELWESHVRRFPGTNRIEDSMGHGAIYS
jgi:hypothetical protein